MSISRFAAISVAALIAASTSGVHAGSTVAPEAVAYVVSEPMTADDRADRSVEERFASAPDGVDPVVTGPVSRDFRKRQQDLDCEAAVWPQIPAGCYPN